MTRIDKTGAAERAKIALLDAATNYVSFRNQAHALGGRQMLDLMDDYERALLNAAVAYREACGEAES